MRPQNDSTIALSCGVPTAPIDGARPASRTFWLNAQDVNCVPRSECMTRSLLGLRSCVAIVKALVTSSVFCWVSIDHPTTLRENAIEDDATVDLTLPGRVLGDVGHPQSVRSGDRELAPDEVGGGKLADLRPLEQPLLWKPVKAETRISSVTVLRLTTMPLPCRSSAPRPVARRKSHRTRDARR
jgi:hypothetical protein